MPPRWVVSAGKWCWTSAWTALRRHRHNEVLWLAAALRPTLRTVAQRARQRDATAVGRHNRVAATEHRTRQDPRRAGCSPIQVTGLERPASY
jgi:hypothetical protein